MNLPKEGKISGGGGGKEIDSNEEEGNLNGTNKQQTKNGGESVKSNEPSKMSESDPRGGGGKLAFCIKVCFVGT